MGGSTTGPGPRSPRRPAVAGGAAIPGVDWAATPLGPVAQWPAALRTLAVTCLASPVPMAVWWGDSAVIVPNDAYAEIAGDVRGRTVAAAWAREWPALRPVVAAILAGGSATSLDHGGRRASLSPVRDESGKVGGVWCVVTGRAAGDRQDGPADASPAPRPASAEARSDALARLARELGAATTAPQVLLAAAGHTGAVLDAAQVRVGRMSPERAAVEVATSGPVAGTATLDQVGSDGGDVLAVAVRENRTVGTTVRESGRHALATPMRYHDGQVIGALYACWESPAGAAGPAEAPGLLHAVGELCGQALQRVELVAATQDVAALAARLSASHTTAEAIDAMLAAAPRILGAQLPAVAEPVAGNRLRLWHHDLPDSLAESYLDLDVDDRRPIAESFRTGKRIFLPDRAAFRARYPGLPDTAGAHGLVSTVAVPLLDHQGRPMAALGMGWSRHRPLRATDLTLLDTVTDLCEQTVQRTRLAAAEHDLVTRLAGRVATSPPRHTRFDIAGRYQPAITGLGLSGDWYDVISLPAHRLAVVVGDVVGHHTEAAADMAQLRTVINTLVRLGTPLDDVFARVTSLLGRGFLGTALIMVLDPGARRLSLVRAGHPHPVVVAGGRPARAVGARGTAPIGLVTGSLPVTVVPFGPGDTVLAFTDGLVERRSHGYDGAVDELRALLSAGGDQPLEDLADTLLTHMPVNDDDRALVLVRAR